VFYLAALNVRSAWFVIGPGVALGVMVVELTFDSAVPHLINGFGSAWSS